MYQDRRTSGLCTQCGAQADRDPRIQNWDQARHRALNPLYKGDAPEYHFYRAYCSGCATLRKEQKEQRERQKHGTADRVAKMRAAREAGGLCIACGEHAPATLRKQCADCLRKKAESVTLRNVRLAESGRCPRCGGARDGDDLKYKVCPDCREKDRRRKKSVAIIAADRARRSDLDLVDGRGGEDGAPPAL